MKKLNSLICYTLFFVLSLSNGYATRQKEALEFFSLKEIQMLGTLQYENQKRAIVGTKGLLHQVIEGDYIGENNGVIKSILYDKIQIEETIINSSTTEKIHKELTIPQNNNIKNDNPLENLSQYSGKRISVTVSQVSVRNFLIVLAQLTGNNFIVSTQVEGLTNLNVSDIPWDSAFDVLLNKNGLSYFKVCDIYLVAPAKEFMQISPEYEELPSNCFKGEKVSFSFSQIELKVLFELFAESKDKTVIIDAKVGGDIAINVTNRPWRLILALVAILHDFSFEMSEKSMTISANSKQ